jgi:hypothetical protein
MRRRVPDWLPSPRPRPETTKPQAGDLGFLVGREGIEPPTPCASCDFWAFVGIRSGAKVLVRAL